MITTITAAAITVKMTVNAWPKPKAAPGLRIALNSSQSPTTLIGAWCSSLATTSILLTRSRAYAKAATTNRTAIRRLPRGRSAADCCWSAPGAPGKPGVRPTAAGSPLWSGMSGVPMMRSASAT